VRPDRVAYVLRSEDRGVCEEMVPDSAEVDVSSGGSLFEGKKRCAEAPELCDALFGYAVRMWGT
jgi:hypothetical protein